MDIVGSCSSNLWASLTNIMFTFFEWQDANGAQLSYIVIQLAQPQLKPSPMLTYFLSNYFFG